MIASSLATGLVLAWAEVSLADIFWYPWWSLRRLAAGMADGLLRIGWGTLQAPIRPEPVRLLRVAKADIGASSYIGHCNVDPRGIVFRDGAASPA